VLVLGNADATEQQREADARESKGLLHWVSLSRAGKADRDFFTRIACLCGDFRRLEHLFATVSDAAVRRKLLSTLRVENSATCGAHGADLAPRLTARPTEQGD
jgi:hypothetical protein